MAHNYNNTHNKTKSTSESFSQKGFKGFKKHPKEKKVNKDLNIDNTEYIRDPFLQLEQPDLNDKKDWWKAENFPPEFIDLFDFIGDRFFNENGDDLEYLIQRVRHSQLSYLYIGSCLRNIKFRKMWEGKYKSFNHFCQVNFRFSSHMGRRYINALTIVLILLRYGITYDLLPTHISHCECLEKFINHEDLLVSKWKEVLANYDVCDITKEAIKKTLYPQETFKKFSTKIDLGSTELVNYITVIARLERVKVGTVIKRLLHRAYSHVVPIIQAIINKSKTSPLTESELSFYRAEYKEINANFTPYFEPLRE